MAYVEGNPFSKCPRPGHALPDAMVPFAAAVAEAEDAYTCLMLFSLDFPQDDETELVATLSEAERRRATRFCRARDRRRYVIAHARLRELLAWRLGIEARQVALSCDRHGKPELEGHQASSGWRFSLSYSDGPGGALALCALSCRGRIGVDVETVRRLDDSHSLARQFFSPREYGIYRRLSPRERPLGFFNCWTRKEAFVKALGTGLSHDLADFDMSLAPGEPARILRVGKTMGDCCGWYVTGIGPASGRVAAVVTERS